jgi:hypothetical protein
VGRCSFPLRQFRQCGFDEGREIARITARDEVAILNDHLIKIFRTGVLDVLDDRTEFRIR